MQEQDISNSWLNNSNGSGVLWDGHGIVSRNVFIPDGLKAHLLDAFRNAVEAEREACAREVERIAWSAPTSNGEWALREVAKVAAAQIRARKD